MTPVTESPNAITLKGNPKTLLGDMPKVGDPAPAFTLVANDMSPKALSDFAGKVKIVSVVPSLDTPVCDTETRRFNEMVGDLGSDVVVLTVSVDTPMAQKRWCGAAGVENVVTLSDFADHTFGYAYGVRIKDVNLLARCVFVIDAQDVVKAVFLVPEVAEEPDYDAVLAAVKELQ